MPFYNISINFSILYNKKALVFDRFCFNFSNANFTLVLKNWTRLFFFPKFLTYALFYIILIIINFLNLIIFKWLKLIMLSCLKLTSIDFHENNNSDNN